MRKRRCINAPYCANKPRGRVRQGYCASCKRMIAEIVRARADEGPRTAAEDFESRRAIHAGRAGGIRDLLPGVR